jgi:hypothetical protein
MEQIIMGDYRYIEENEYINMLKNGKQIRIIYNKKRYDDCENQGWWFEELYCYNNKLNLFICYYPNSSYKPTFFTIHSENYIIDEINNAIKRKRNSSEHKTTTEILIEVCNKAACKLNIKELAIERIKCMNEKEVMDTILSI